MLECTDDLASLESIIRQHAPIVFKVAYGILRNPHDAEEIVQEVFLRVHRSGMKDIREVRAWLATLAYRIAIDRKRKPQPMELGEMDIAGEDPGAEDIAIERQTIRQVQALIAALPSELRAPLVLSALDELNSREIAQVLGISEAAVRSRIFRARQILKEKLSTMTERKP